MSAALSWNWIQLLRRNMKKGVNELNVSIYFLVIVDLLNLCCAYDKDGRFFGEFSLMYSFDFWCTSNRIVLNFTSPYLKSIELLRTMAVFMKNLFPSNALTLTLVFDIYIWKIRHCGLKPDNRCGDICFLCLPAIISI